MTADRPSEIDVYDQVLTDLRSKVRTLTGGRVVKYDRTKRTAKVQPLRRGRGPTGEPFDLDVITVPVLWPAFAGIVIRGKLRPGDDLALAVFDRELDPYLAKRGPFDPVSSRMHSLTDAIGLPGLSLLSKPLQGAAAGDADLYIGREDGSAYVSIGIDQPGRLTIETAAGQLRLGAGATEPAVLGATLQTALLAFAATVNAMLPTGTAVQNAAALEVIRGAVVALTTDLADILATKVLVQ